MTPELPGFGHCRQVVGVPGSEGDRAGTRRGNVAKADRLEMNATHEIVWVVVFNGDQGELSLC